jgi:hypothetical protein
MSCALCATDNTTVAQNVNSDCDIRVTTLMHDLLISPEDYRKHIERATASFGSITLFGQRATTHDDFWTTVSESTKVLKG